MFARLQVLAEQPYFARVNNRTVVGPGEVAYLPCRVKSSQEGYMVSVEIFLSNSRATYVVVYKCIDTTALRLQIRLDTIHLISLDSRVILQLQAAARL